VKAVRLLPEQWQRADEYLYGIDLYNYAYWWECHEVLERLWHAAGHKTEQGNFFRALIQLAAANLKYFLGHCQAAGNLLQRGLTRFERVPDCYMGIDVARLIDHLRQHKQGPAPLIRMNR
jgi:predicted metal-dependent hydrolase